ncbi:MAG TPA: hypothetical protein VLE95_03310 [Chlamydiales bacterium]|nr:hypothetical protein [Chlamydiales bacterium]
MTSSISRISYGIGRIYPVNHIRCSRVSHENVRFLCPDFKNLLANRRKATNLFDVHRLDDLITEHSHLDALKKLINDAKRNPAGLLGSRLEINYPTRRDIDIMDEAQGFRIGTEMIEEPQLYKDDFDVVWLVIEGEGSLVFKNGEETIPIRSGDFLEIPIGTEYFFEDCDKDHPMLALRTPCTESAYADVQCAIS